MSCRFFIQWISEPSGFSNGALVKGYVVYADGQRTKEAKGATS
jgi:hypothetical protein